MLRQKDCWVNLSSPRVHMSTFGAVMKEGRKAGLSGDVRWVVWLEGVLAGNNEGCGQVGGVEEWIKTSSID